MHVEEGHAVRAMGQPSISSWKGSSSGCVFISHQDVVMMRLLYHSVLLLLAVLHPAYHTRWHIEPCHIEVSTGRLSCLMSSTVLNTGLSNRGSLQTCPLPGAEYVHIQIRYIGVCARRAANVLILVLMASIRLGS
jgi:hypothetical protein